MRRFEEPIYEVPGSGTENQRLSGRHGFGVLGLEGNFFGHGGTLKTPGEEPFRALIPICWC